MALYAVTVDIEKLVNLVQERTCLWDNRDTTYRNKVAKDKVWEVVFVEIVGENWKCFNDYEQNVIGSAIQKRWRSLRDLFKRHVNEKNVVRSGSGGVHHTKHLLFDHLAFLRLTFSIRQTACSTVASSRSTHKDSHACTEEATEAPEDQPEAVASVAGASEAGTGQQLGQRGFPLINLGRRAANRVDIAALINMTNHSLGGIERAMDQLRLDVVRVYTSDEEDAEFLIAMRNGMKHVRPEDRAELHLAMHELIGSFMR